MKKKKVYSKSYRKSLTDVYNRAFADGYNACADEYRFGSRFIGAYGYGRGMNAKKRAVKAKNKAQKYTVYSW